MLIDTNEVMEFLNTLAKEEKLKVTIKRCVRSGVIIGSSSALGGLLLGPFGLAIGAVVSGCATAFSEKDKFESVVNILEGMSPEEREALADNVRRIAQGLNTTDIVLFVSLVNGNTTIRKQVINELLNFVSKEVKMAIAN